MVRGAGGAAVVGGGEMVSSPAMVAARSFPTSLASSVLEGAAREAPGAAELPRTTSGKVGIKKKAETKATLARALEPRWVDQARPLCARLLILSVIQTV